MDNSLDMAISVSFPCCVMSHTLPQKPLVLAGTVMKVSLWHWEVVGSVIFRGNCLGGFATQ